MITIVIILIVRNVHQMVLKRRSGINPRQRTTVRPEKVGKVMIFGLPTPNWQWETRQLDESSQRRSGRRKLGAAPLSQGCSEARVRYFPKEKEKREGEEEEET